MLRNYICNWGGELNHDFYSVLTISLFPKDLTFLIGKRWYQLFFSVFQQVILPLGQPMTPPWTGSLRCTTSPLCELNDLWHVMLMVPLEVQIDSFESVNSADISMFWCRFAKDLVKLLWESCSFTELDVCICFTWALTCWMPAVYSCIEPT